MISFSFSSLDIAAISGYILPRMKYEVVIVRSVQEVFKRLDAHKLEHDEKFLRKIAEAREEIRKGQYVTLDELPG